MATIQLILNAIDKASKPFRDVAESAQDAADRIDKLNEKIDATDRALSGAEASAKLAESGMRGAGREADVLAAKLAVLNSQLDDLDGTRTARVKVDVDRSMLSRLGGLFGGGRGGDRGTGGNLAAMLAPGGKNAGAAFSALPAQAQAGVVAVAVAAAPFIAQQVASVITFGLGSALAGVGVAGALMSQMPATLTAAQTNYQGASANLVSAIHTSPADLKAYQAALKGLEPDLRSAAVLLTNQNVQWQNLTPAQQAAEIALRNNSSAYKALLPDQKNALDALLKQQTAWNALTPAQQKAARATAGMQTSLQNLQQTASDALTQIGAPMVGVLTSIFNTADKLIGTMTPVFVTAEKTIAGPLQILGNTLVNSFAQPAVKTSIQAVATAFGQLLKALTPQIPGDIAGIANGITAVAKAVGANPKPFADFIQFLAKAAEFSLIAIADLTRVASYVEAHWVPVFDGARHEVAHIWDDMASDMIRTWGATWNDTMGITIRFGHNVETQFNSLRHGTANTFDGIRHDIASIWDMAWNNTVGRAQRGISDVEHWLGTLPGAAMHEIGALGGDLQRFGSSVMSDLWNGLKSVWGGIAHWFGGLPGDILHALGIHSPPDWALRAGESIAQGLFGWTTSKQHQIAAQFQGLGGSVGASVASGIGQMGGTVTDWITAALQATGNPLSWLPLISVLVSKESGGNPLAYNPVGVYGEHAEGIAQTLPSTFAKFGLGGSIWNPVSDLIAALRYIDTVYGSPYNIAGLLGGTYRGYDSGGILPPGFHLVANLTGRPEQVVPAGGAGHGGPLIHIGEMNVREESDVALVAQRLSGMIRMAGLGGGFSHAGLS